MLFGFSAFSDSAKPYECMSVFFTVFDRTLHLVLPYEFNFFHANIPTDEIICRHFIRAFSLIITSIDSTENFDRPLFSWQEEPWDWEDYLSCNNYIQSCHGIFFLLQTRPNSYPENDESDPLPISTKTLVPTNKFIKAQLTQLNKPSTAYNLNVHTKLNSPIESNLQKKNGKDLL